MEHHPDITGIAQQACSMDSVAADLRMMELMTHGRLWLAGGNFYPWRVSVERTFGCRHRTYIKQ